MKILKEIIHYLAVPFVVIAFGFNALSIKSKAKKYKKSPKSVFIEDRLRIINKAAKKALFIKNIKITYTGFNRLPKKPLLFIPNHKNSLDPVAVFNAIYDHLNSTPSTFVAKHELSKSKLISAAVTILDGIFLERENPRSVYKCFLEEDSLIKSNHSLVVFPEGTRINGDQFGEFKSAVLKVAYQNFTSIVPVVIYGSEESTIKKTRGQKVIYIKALKVLQPNDFVNVKQEHLIDTIKAEMQDVYFDLKKMSEKKQLFEKEEGK